MKFYPAGYFIEALSEDFNLQCADAKEQGVTVYAHLRMCAARLRKVQDRREQELPMDESFVPSAQLLWGMAASKMWFYETLVTRAEHEKKLGDKDLKKVCFAMLAELSDITRVLKPIIDASGNFVSGNSEEQEV